MNLKSLSLLAIAATLFSTAPMDLTARPGNGPGRGSDSRHGDSGRQGGSHNDRDRGDWRHGKPSYSRSGAVSIRNSRGRSVVIELRDTNGRVRSRRHMSPGEREYISTSARSGWTITVRQHNRVQRFSLTSIGSFSHGRWYIRI